MEYTRWGVCACVWGQEVVVMKGKAERTSKSQVMVDWKC
jgi:hypothetical protein